MALKYNLNDFNTPNDVTIYGEMYFYNNLILHELLKGTFKITIDDKNYWNRSYCLKINYKHKSSSFKLEKVTELLDKFRLLKDNKQLFNIVFFSSTKLERENNKFDFSFSAENCNYSKFDYDYYSLTLALTTPIDDVRLGRQNINPRFC